MWGGMSGTHDGTILREATRTEAIGPEFSQAALWSQDGTMLVGNAPLGNGLVIFDAESGEVVFEIPRVGQGEDAPSWQRLSQ